MTLTKQDVLTLTAPFKAEDHEFLRGNAYITEEAIVTRLEEIDPSWTFERLEITTRDKSVIAVARMTVAGVYRDGVGMAGIVTYTNKKTGELDEANEAEKSAITDALKRCARLFGIGRYLLDIPRDADRKPTVTNTQQLAKWLSTKFPAPKSAAPPPATQPTKPVFDGVNPPQVSEPALDWEAQERLKVQAAMDTEAVSIFKIRYTPTQNGLGLPCWTATARMINGGTFPITVWTEHVNMVKKMGYSWPDTDADNVDILVITEAHGSERRIKTVLPMENPYSGKVAQNANLPLSGPEKDPTWFATPISGCWGVTKGWLLAHVYEKNTFAMNGSLVKRGIIADKKATQPVEAWANRTAGELIHFLENRHDDLLQEAS